MGCGGEATRANGKGGKATPLVEARHRPRMHECASPEPPAGAHSARTHTDKATDQRQQRREGRQQAKGRASGHRTDAKRFGVSRPRSPKLPLPIASGLAARKKTIHCARKGGREKRTVCVSVCVCACVCSVSMLDATRPQHRHHHLQISIQPANTHPKHTQTQSTVN